MKKILVNSNPWQTRITIVRDGKIQGIYFSAHAKETLERSFFKGVVIKVLPGIQTAFVDIGQSRAGFLHISEIDRELAIENLSKHSQLLEEREESAPRPSRRQQTDIAKILKEGEHILVQVSKEPIYEKGAKLSTCFTLPGRFIVLLPNIPRIGISKKIDNRDERTRLKEIVKKHLPEGMGAIIRTTSEERGEREISEDVSYLVKTWKKIQKKYATAKETEKIHEDIDLSLQIIRDHLDEDIESVIVDDEELQDSIFKFVKSMAPEFSHKIKLYEGPTPIFEYYGIEKQIEETLEKKVPLKSGGSLIVETTEAMTVVDVNTGKFVGKTNLEDTIFKTNVEAAEEVVRQLKLRNIGGLIVIDFIDMATSANRQKLFKYFEKTLREQDKFQSVVLKISEFGLVQMTRKRSGKTLIQELTDTCPTCKGYGFIKSLETESHTLLRHIKYALKTDKVSGKKITLHVCPEILEHWTNVEFNAILILEKDYSCKITLLSQKNFKINQYKIEKK